jgi:hypothetical protein
LQQLFTTWQTVVSVASLHVQASCSVLNWLHHALSHIVEYPVNNPFIACCQDVKNDSEFCFSALQTGELPDPEMVPEHNDERWLNDDSEDLLLEDDSSSSSKAGGRAGTAARGKKASAQGTAAGSGKCYTVNGAALTDLRQWAADLVAQQQQHGAGMVPAKASAGGAKLPLQLAANLQLLSLGRVEFLHPGFHTEKFIWPVGFAVRRRARTPASGGKELWHTAEVLEQPDGSGPMFR